MQLFGRMLTLIDEIIVGEIYYPMTGQGFHSPLSNSNDFDSKKAVEDYQETILNHEEFQETALPKSGSGKDFRLFAEKKTSNSHKEWTIVFSTGFEASTITSNNIYVTTKGGKPLPTKNVIVDTNTVKVNAPTTGYTVGTTYYLLIDDVIYSSNGTTLKDPVYLKFTVVE